MVPEIWILDNCRKQILVGHTGSGVVCVRGIETAFDANVNSVWHQCADLELDDVVCRCLVRQKLEFDSVVFVDIQPDYHRHYHFCVCCLGNSTAHYAQQTQ